MVFYWRSDDMAALFLRGKGDAFDGQIIAFGATAHKGDLSRSASKNIGYLFASAVDGLHGMATQGVDTAGIAVFGCKVRKHDVQYAWIKCGSGGMVEIDCALWHDGFLIRGHSSYRLYRVSRWGCYKLS